MNNQALDITTEKRLLSRLMAAAKHHPSAAELQQQRISFIFGSVSKSSEITRAQIEKVLNQHAGCTGDGSDPV